MNFREFRTTAGTTKVRALRVLIERVFYERARDLSSK